MQGSDLRKRILLLYGLKIMGVVNSFLLASLASRTLQSAHSSEVSTVPLQLRLEHHYQQHAQVTQFFFKVSLAAYQLEPKCG